MASLGEATVRVKIEGIDEAVDAIQKLREALDSLKIVTTWEDGSYVGTSAVTTSTGNATITHASVESTPTGE